MLNESKILWGQISLKKKKNWLKLAKKKKNPSKGEKT